VILVAGLGNELFADDAFGVEVARRLRERALPDDVVVREVGIRGMDLAFALMDGFDAVVLVDAIARGYPPGTLVVLDPERPEAAPLRDSHGLDPVRMLAMVEAAGGCRPVLRIVGCEPERLVDEDTALAQGLSSTVAAAIPAAIDLVLTTIEGLRAHA
jgi:hydrogenase maturation protease